MRTFQFASVLGLVSTAVVIFAISTCTVWEVQNRLSPLAVVKQERNRYVVSQVRELDVWRTKYLAAVTFAEKRKVRSEILRKFVLLDQSELPSDLRTFYCHMAGMSWQACAEPS